MTIFAAAPLGAEPASAPPRLTPITAPAAEPLVLPGVALPQGRFGLGFYDAGPRRPQQLSIRDALGPRHKRAPGIGLKLAF